jgi:hypothetical protein
MENIGSHYIGIKSYMAGMERRPKATTWRYVMAVLSGMRGACILCVCVVPPCWWVSCAGVASEFAHVLLSSPTCVWTRFGGGG